MKYKTVRTPNPEYVEETHTAEKWVKYYSKRSPLGFDTETTGLDKFKARIKFFSMSDGKTRICAPVRLLPLFAPLLEDEAVVKRMSNSKFDLHMLANHGILVSGPVYDTQVMDFLVDENRVGRHGLKTCAADYLGLRMMPFSAVFGKVGKTDDEVRIISSIHDALEDHDEEKAADILVLMRSGDADPEVLDALRILVISAHGGVSLEAKKLLAIARKFSLAPKSSGKLSYVSDFSVLLGGPSLTTAERPDFACIMEDKSLLVQAQRYLTQKLRTLVDLSEDPLAHLRHLMADYASLDAWATYSVTDAQMEILSNEHLLDDSGRTLLDFYEQERIPLTKTLWLMERRGIKIDADKISALERPMAKEIGNLERRAVALVGADVNLNSHDQLRNALFTQDAQGLWHDPWGGTPRLMTDGGLPSTTSEVLEEFSERGNELAIIVSEHRKLQKLHGTYLVNIPGWVDFRNRAHTSLSEDARTGRLASSDPGLHQIPSKKPWGPKFRDAFMEGTYGECNPLLALTSKLASIRPKGVSDDEEMSLIVADYKQVEMCIMAHFSEDQGMIDAIVNNRDLHCVTAELALGADYDEMAEAKEADDRGDKLTTRQEELLVIRSQMKAVGFGLLYGIGPQKLGRNLGLNVIEEVSRRTGRSYLKCPEAEALIRAYFDGLPGVEAFIEATHRRARKDLQVYTIAGRPRRLPDISAEDGGVASYARRQSVNSIVQGSGADITLRAMLKCESDIRLRKLGVRQLLQIHDELVFGCPTKYLEDAMPIIKQDMEDPYPMLVPIRVSIHSGRTWAEAK